MIEDDSPSPVAPPEGPRPEDAPLFLEGEDVHLRSLIPADAEGPYPTWFNDAEVCEANGHHYHPYTRKDALEYIEHARTTDEALILAIVRDDDQRHIGNVSLQDIDPIARTAEFAIVIGDKDSWGHGFSKEAARLICEHGFTELNLHRIHCGTFASNTAMQRLAEHLGMEQEGRRREAAWNGGEYVDVVEYGVLREEFEETFDL